MNTLREKKLRLVYVTINRVGFKKIIYFEYIFLSTVSLLRCTALVDDYGGYCGAVCHGFTNIDT